MFTQLLSKAKDGGPKSPVDGYFIFEIKNLCSIALLKFNKGCREEYHTHAFNALTWFLSGDMIEQEVSGKTYKYKKSLIPKITSRSKNHRVLASKDSWCLTLRGPWQTTWTETSQDLSTVTTLTHGRKIV
jgi:quercetin dioxygenase-like cupin family protein